MSKEITPETKHEEFLSSIRRGRDFFYLTWDAMDKLYRKLGRVTLKNYEDCFWQLRVEGERLLLELCPNKVELVGLFEEKHSVSLELLQLQWKEQGFLFYTQRRRKDGRIKYRVFLMTPQMVTFYERLHLRKLVSNIPYAFDNVWEHHEKAGDIQHTDFMMIRSDGTIFYDKETRKPHRVVEVPDDVVLVVERYRCDRKNTLDKNVFYVGDFGFALKYEERIKNFLKGGF